MLPERWRGGPRWVVPEPLNVAPAIVGLPLASPLKRAYAMGVDLAVVALLSSLGDFWLAIGLLAVVFQLRSPPGAVGPWRRAAGWLVVALFVGFALRAGWVAWQERDAGPPPDPEVKALAKARAVGEGLPEAERIEALQHALANALVPEPVPLRERVSEALDEVGASFGWGIVYFSLVPAFWRGQTIGKRLFRLQVLELTGQEMTVMRSLKRYGGYAAGMATGGLGFTQMLWDPNRQAIQDRAAHTVVVDRRAARAAQDTAPGP